MAPVWWLNITAWVLLALFFAIFVYMVWITVADWVEEQRTIRAVRRHMRERREQVAREAHQRELDGLANAAEAAIDQARTTVDQEPSQ